MNTDIKTKDRRVLRTRLALRDALISLLGEVSWDDINIQMLCERANIGRSTFYLHFQNKEELLVNSFDNLREFICAQPNIAHGKPSGSLPFVRGLIEHVDEQRTVFRAIIGKRSGHVVHKNFREMVNQLVAAEIPHAAKGWQGDASARYISGALVELLAWWVDAGADQTGDDIEKLFYQLTLPAIKQRGENI